MTARSPGPRRSRRAASSASSVGGSVAASPSRKAVASCSTKRGFPSAASTSPARAFVRHLARPGKGIQELVRFLRRQRAEHERRRVELAAAPAGALLDEIQPGNTEQEHRDVVEPLDEVVDQVEEGRLRPVQILENDDERPGRGQVFQHPSRSGEELIGSRSSGDQARHLRGRLALSGLANDFGQGPIGHPLAERRALS